MDKDSGFAPIEKRRDLIGNHFEDACKGIQPAQINHVLLCATV
jgi:hypothetical protein